MSYFCLKFFSDFFSKGLGLLDTESGTGMLMQQAYGKCSEINIWGGVKEEELDRGDAELWCSLSRCLASSYGGFINGMSLQSCPEVGWRGQAFVLTALSLTGYGMWSWAWQLSWSRAVLKREWAVRDGLQHPRQPGKWVPGFWRGIWMAHHIIQLSKTKCRGSNLLSPAHKALHSWPGTRSPPAHHILSSQPGSPSHPLPWPHSSIEKFLHILQITVECISSKKPPMTTLADSVTLLPSMEVRSTDPVTRVWISALPLVSYVCVT